ncbi:MAG: CHAD domain-containing protein [Actinomycetes bacterium]
MVGPERVMTLEPRDGLGTTMDTLARRFAVEPGTRRVTRRVWLDTYDWRLHRAGMCASATQHSTEQESGHELVVFTADGASASQRLPAVRWPSLVDALPPGPVRDCVSAKVSVRALLPVAEETLELQRVRLLDANDKIVALVDVEHPAQDQGTPERSLLRLRPLRGYEAEARRAHRLLDATGAVTIAPWTTPRDLALASSSRRPGDYTGKLDVRLDGQAPVGEAVSRILDELRDHVEINVPGVLEEVDTECLHDLRVAVRRSRSVMKLTRSVQPVDLAGPFAAELKWLGGVTTPGRDLDVYLLGLDEMAGWLVSATPDDLGPLAVHLRRRRRREQRRLAGSLGSARFARLLDRWKDLIAASEASAEPLTADALAARCLARADRRVVRLGSSVTAESPATLMHDLRKRAKELRYAVEVFASLHDPAVLGRTVGRLKGLQDCLGRFQDSEVQRAGIRTFAEEMIEAGTSSSATLLAMGELTAHLQADQDRARAEFGARFADFMAPPNRRRMDALVAGAGR